MADEIANREIISHMSLSTDLRLQQAEVISEDEYFNREEQCVDRLECIKQVGPA